MGNVLATILDRRTLFDTEITCTYTFAIWDDVIVAGQDYYPGGMLLPNRIYSADSIGTGKYRYGFDGVERDNDWNGAGNVYDFGARMYDSRLVRWSAIDPAFKEYTSLSPYGFTAGNPILFVEIDGRVFDLSNLSDEQRHQYTALVHLISEKSSIFNYYYTKLNQSETVFTIVLGEETNFRPEGNVVTIVDLTSSGAFHLAQELFHAYQSDQVEYDKPESESTIETEGDLIAIYVGFQSGIGWAPNDWADEYFSELPLPTTTLNKEQVQSAEFSTLVNKTVDARISYWEELESQGRKVPESYIKPNSGTRPNAMINVLIEGDETLIGPRLPNGDFYPSEN